MKKILVAIILAGFTAGCLAQQAIQVSLYHGLNDLQCDDVPPGHPLRKSLDPLIGYKHYQKVGEAVCAFNVDYDQWLLPSKVFFLRVNRVNEREAHLELFREKKSIIQSEFPIVRKKPLLITGPLYGNGKLVLIITNPKRPKN